MSENSALPIVGSVTFHGPQYIPDGYALIAKPKWRRFSEELPDCDKFIYIVENGFLFREKLYDVSRRSESLMVMQSNEVYASSCYWTYASDLQLDTLLP